MSYASDMGYDSYDVMDIPLHTGNQAHWKRGVHYDSDDKRHFLSEMTTSHLEACIRKWPNKDTTPIREELESRLQNK